MGLGGLRAEDRLYKMTHLDLAFLNPPLCDGPCTAKSDMTISEKNLTDAGIDAVVTAAHAHGVKVLASIGGAAKDKNICSFITRGFRSRWRLRCLIM